MQKSTNKMRTQWVNWIMEQGSQIQGLLNTVSHHSSFNLKTPSWTSRKMVTNGTDRIIRNLESVQKGPWKTVIDSDYYYYRRLQIIFL